jgi:hypothetical protein
MLYLGLLFLFLSLNVSWLLTSLSNDNFKSYIFRDKLETHVLHIALVINYNFMLHKF